MTTNRKTARPTPDPGMKNPDKKKKFHKVCFSISERDFKKYSRLCQYEGIRFKQLIKKALREYLEQSDLRSWEEVPENQLDIFTQIDLFGQPVLPAIPGKGIQGRTQPDKPEAKGEKPRQA